MKSRGTSLAQRHARVAPALTATLTLSLTLSALAPLRAPLRAPHSGQQVIEASVRPHG